MAAGVGKGDDLPALVEQGRAAAQRHGRGRRAGPRHPDTGGLREDLIVVLTQVVELFGGCSGRAIRSLLGAVVDDPVLQEGCRRLPLANWDVAWETVLARAVQRGEVPAQVGEPAAAEVGPAVLGLRWLVTGRPLDDAVVTELVDRVLLPLLRRP